MNLFSALKEFDSLVFAGEALSHCVGESMSSYMNKPGHAGQKVYLLSDCTSPVFGFDRMESLSRLESAGIEFVTTGL
jgi:nicotinamidase-related amidase